MKALSSFVTRVTPYVNGAPQPLIEQAVVDAAISFCEDSLAMREIQTTTATVATQASYTLPGATDQEVCRVLNVWVNNRWIPPASADSVDYSDARSSQPTGYYTTRVNSVMKLVLVPIPDAVYSLQVEVAYRPLRTATTLQDEIFNQWVDAITKGASGRLMQIPGQSYSDSSTAATNLVIAKSIAMKAKADAVVGRVQTSRAVRSRPFA
jgi:hypothetical protein